MTDTIGWADELERKFGAKLLVDGRFQEVVRYIENLLATQKREIREKVEGMIAEHEHNPEYCGDDQAMCRDMVREIGIYNTACRDVLALLDELSSL